MEVATVVIFVCHSSLDECYVKDFIYHVGPVLDVRRNGLRFWEDSMIFPGAVWNKEIEEAISNSIAALIIVSDNLMNSSYAMTKELPKFLEAARKTSLDIFCLYARDCLIDEITFTINVNGIQEQVKLTDYQGLNSPNAPLDSFHFKKKQKHEMLQAARKLLASLRSRPGPNVEAKLARASVSGVGR